MHIANRILQVDSATVLQAQAPDIRLTYNQADMMMTYNKLETSRKTTASSGKTCLKVYDLSSDNELWQW